MNSTNTFKYVHTKAILSHPQQHGMNIHRTFPMALVLAYNCGWTCYSTALSIPIRHLFFVTNGFTIFSLVTCLAELHTYISIYRIYVHTDTNRLINNTQTGPLQDTLSEDTKILKKKQKSSFKNVFQSNGLAAFQWVECLIRFRWI